jgi:hypothetical protein
MNTVVAAGSIVEYLQTSAKAFARGAWGKNVDLGSHLGSERTPLPSEIDRDDLAQWQGNCGLSERKAAVVDKTPVN